MHILLKILIVLAVLYLIICLFFYWAQDRMLFFPQHLPQDYAFHFTAPFEEVFIPTTDDAQLHGLLFKAENAKGIIIYFHGNAGSLVGWGEIGQDLLRYGYDVFVFDYRNYGKSTGKAGFEIMLEDADIIYQHVKQSYDDDEIILFGRSLGTGFASFVASRHPVKGLILETPYHSIGDVAGTYFPFLPVRLINRYPINSYKYLETANMPILILHGTSDQVVPYKSGQKLLATMGDKNVKFVTLEKGQHNNLADYPLFWEEVGHFLNL